jgi:hypothetical protein
MSVTSRKTPLNWQRIALIAAIAAVVSLALSAVMCSTGLVSGPG